MAASNAPVPYMARTQAYYAAQGYPKSYAWAQHDEVPFSLPSRRLTESRLTLVTTASPIAERRAGDGVSASAETLLVKKALFHGQVDEPPTALFTGDLSWDKETTHTEDLGSYFPLELLKQLVREGVIGSLTPSYHCVPTEYSQRQTVAEDAPAIRDKALAEGADIALLVPL